MGLLSFLFWCFAGWAILSALLCITRSNPVASAPWLVSTMFSLAGIFVLLDAQFIAAIQVLVYAGAVMVLFLFVIMLLNLEETPRDWNRWMIWVAGAGLSIVVGAQLFVLSGYSPQRLANEFSSIPSPNPAFVFPEGEIVVRMAEQHGVVGAVAQPLFQSYLIPFEITSVLLLSAVIGSVVLAKKRL
jgi:NADH-quinone oxidoreductase subunit J